MSQRCAKGRRFLPIGDPLPKRPRAAELAKIVGAKCDDAPVANDDARNAFYRDDMRARISTKTQPEEAGG